MIAVKRLQSIFWVLLVTLGAIAVYLVSLRVASERTELARVERQILSAKREIRYLETEFGARASMRQLERWNSENFRFSTPTAAQYLDGERALASLEGVTPTGPAYVATPVMTAMVEGPADLPSAVAKAVAVQPEVSSDAVTARPAPESRAPAVARTDAPAKAEKPPVRTAQAVAAPAPRPAPKTTADARRVERVAMLEQTLLDDHTMGDLARLAAREKGRAMR
ncbi:colicin transporter [Rhizorhapis suberifaciens]|uniref:Colicin transporter n=1 Tax=Rhizorhapis suberifaciens TaxID=13656 RepID=A0A840HQ51_9SPHN|nr:colicin transporter [Rhizorhapis suberifaciens]MBB4639728.1 hypothetical protein [Rhizorhapis suberifaciens]